MNKLEAARRGINRERKELNRQKRLRALERREEMFEAQRMRRRVNGQANIATAVITVVALVTVCIMQVCAS